MKICNEWIPYFISECPQNMHNTSNIHNTHTYIEQIEKRGEWMRGNQSHALYV